MIKDTSITIELHGRIEIHDDLYVSYCDELPLIGTGATSEDAMASLLTCLKEYTRLSLEWGVAEEAVWRHRTTMAPEKFTLSLPRNTRGRGAPVAA